MRLLLKDKNYDKDTLEYIEDMLLKLPRRFKQDYLDMIYQEHQTYETATRNTEQFLDDIMNNITEFEQRRIFGPQYTYNKIPKIEIKKIQIPGDTTSHASILKNLKEKYIKQALEEAYYEHRYE